MLTQALFRGVIAPGFFASSSVRLALAAGSAVALVSAVVGVFTVIRGQAFAGEALSDVGAAGGSGAFLAGVSPLWGFVAVALAGSGAMELIGVGRARGRDLATGVVLGAGFGLSALFLYLTTTQTGTTGATITVLFGSLLELGSGELPAILALSAGVLLVLAASFRPLLLASASQELAAAQRIPVRLCGAIHLVAVAITVALAARTVGAVLATALLIGPAAAALRISRSPAHAMLGAAGIGVTVVWLGVLLAYDSYSWPPIHHGWPVSFFIVALALLAYGLASWFGAHGRRAR